MQKAGRTKSVGREANRRHTGKEGRSRVEEQSPLSRLTKETWMTYSQRTIKDVNIALYINLTAPSPPEKGKQAGEKRGWKFRALC